MEVLVMACVYTAVLTGIFVFLVISMQRSWAERVRLQDELRAAEVARIQRAFEKSQEQCHTAYAALLASGARGVAPWSVPLPHQPVPGGPPQKFPMGNGNLAYSARKPTGAGMPSHFANEEGTGFRYASG